MSEKPYREPAPLDPDAAIEAANAEKRAAARDNQLIWLFVFAVVFSFGAATLMGVIAERVLLAIEIAGTLWCIGLTVAAFTALSREKRS